MTKLLINKLKQDLDRIMKHIYGFYTDRSIYKTVIQCLTSVNPVVLLLTREWNITAAIILPGKKTLISILLSYLCNSAHTSTHT